MTIIEGVVQYLSEGAVDATLRAVRALSLPGSVLAVEHLAPNVARLRAPEALHGWRRSAARRGEPLDFCGWEPGAAAPWLRHRGWDVQTECSLAAAARACGSTWARDGGAPLWRAMFVVVARAA